MNNIRFYKITIIILVMVNLGTLAFLWFGRPRPGQMPVSGEAAEYLIDELKLTPGQQDQFGKLRKEHRGKLSLLQAEDRRLHDLFFESLFLIPADTLTVNVLADSMAGLRRQMELLTFEHFRQLRLLLTEEQSRKFHQVFNQALERVMPLPPMPPMPPMPPPPPGGKQ
ncbi:MAG: Spy/CpxP family protein refolding chaperone [Bacteroidetes bacterium]|nr:Spy/CpxP family protein refolding chaperone [Bacteroidota bacterium]